MRSYPKLDRNASWLYWGDTEKDILNSLHYQLFTKLATNMKVTLAYLLPMGDAASHHSYRTYHQVQKWLGNKNPTDWGWKIDDQGLIPISTNMDPAPENLLHLISCTCRKRCKRGCSCRKAGLKCSALCTVSCGKSCHNVSSIYLKNSNYDKDDCGPNFIGQVEEHSTRSGSHRGFLKARIIETKEIIM